MVCIAVCTRAGEIQRQTIAARFKHSSDTRARFTRSTEFFNRDEACSMHTPDLSPKPSVGLGLRRGLLSDLQAAPAGDFDFLEVAPENWIGIGGAHGAALRALAERYPLS